MRGPDDTGLNAFSVSAVALATVMVQPAARMAAPAGAGLKPLTRADVIARDSDRRHASPTVAAARRPREPSQLSRARRSTSRSQPAVSPGGAISHSTARRVNVHQPNSHEWLRFDTISG